MSATNEQCVLKAFDAIAYGDEETFADRCVHASYRNHEAAPDRPTGPESFKQTARTLRHAFADLRFDVHDVIVGDEKVVVRCQFSGRHVAPFNGMPAAGRTFSVQHIHIFRLEGGKLAEHWACRDDAGAMRQLGLLPSGAETSRTPAESGAASVAT